MNTVTRIVVLAALASAPLLAQGGGRGTPPPRQTPQGMVLDFQSQDINVVLQAIAEAGNLNISLINIPSTVTVTLRANAQMTRDEAREMLISIAEGNNITVTETNSLIRLVGAPRQTTPQLTAAQQALLAQASQQRQLQIYPVRLKHANAVTLAPVLLNLVRGAGFTGGRGTQILPAGLQQQGRGNAQQQQQQGRGGAAGGGRGGAADVVFQPQVIQAPVIGGNQQQGRGNAQQALQNALAQQIAQTFGVQIAPQQGATASLAFTDTNIQAEELTNTLLIRATAEDFAALQQLVQSLDLRPLQVLIEVTIAQVERRDDLNVGVSGSRTERRSRDTSSITLPGVSTARDFVALLRGGNGAVGYDVALNALQSRGDVRVRSMPVIIAQNNRQAVLNVGSSVPFVQISQTVPNDPTGRVETLSYLPVGTTLTITPIINSDGYVNMAVQQTNDNVTENVQFNAPIISQRQATTNVFVRDGQTTVIGGLADQTTNKTKTGIPFFSRIPFIGSWLFGNTQNNTVTSELYLFLTPHIVSDDADIDRMRESIRLGTEMLQGVPVSGRIMPRADTITVRDTVIRRVPPDTGRLSSQR
jgi:type II secretory pathway component GspD/PulD (secretin)